LDDTCQPLGEQRACVGGAPFVCPDPSPEVCKLKVCESTNGACISLFKTNGTPCPSGGCIAGGCFLYGAPGSGGAGAGGGDQGGGGGAGTTGSTTAAGSGGAGASPPEAGPADNSILRLHGNGCALARSPSPSREDTAAAWLLAAGLLTVRRRRARA
jgi:MYXO-CTERM domain-containing protein